MSNPIKIGFLVIGTNNYVDLALQCINAIRKYIQIPNAEICPFLFTNVPEKDVYGKARFKYLYIDHNSWPLITLLRYQNFIRYSKELSETDYLFYIDADLLPVADIGSEILGNLVATLHPGFYNKHPMYFTYDRNPESKSYIPYGEGNSYYIGSMQGGRTKNYLNASLIMRDWINEDLKKNYIPLWHDESMWNKYCYLQPPPDRVLDPRYCSPEGWDHIPAQFGPPKIIALSKDHNAIRTEKSLT